jgi:hypothetical protein
MSRLKKILCTKEKINNLFDKEGLICKPDGNKCYLNENRILLNADYFLLLRSIGLIDREKESKLKKTISSLWAKGIPGLLSRYPGTPLGSDKHELEIERHDNYLGLACLDKEAARQIYRYGLLHLFHYDPRSFKENVKEFGFWGAIKEHLACTRQPYQMAIISLCAYGFAFPLSWLHLFFTVIVELFKPMKHTSGKLILWRFSMACPKSILAKIYSYFMHLRDKNFECKIAQTYYNTKFPELVKLYYYITKK